MPPRLSALGALRPLDKPSSSRAFSATASVAAPPREGSHTPSSTSSLLSLNRPKGHNRNHQSRTPQQGGKGGSSTRASDAAEQLLSRFGSRSAQLAKRTQATADSLREQKISNDYLREMPRRWVPGDVYSPHDLSPVEMTKWRKRAERKGDVIDALALRPLDMYKVRERQKSERYKSEGVMLTCVILRTSP
jgi:small subunit ribosomal protein S18